MEAKTCSVCDEIKTGERMGHFGDEALDSRYPVCCDCHESGRHDQWRKKAIGMLRTSNVGFISKGNLADDFQQLQGWLRHDSRIQDGVCPNGCALMVAVDTHNAQCPVCHFVLYQNTGIKTLIVG